MRAWLLIIILGLITGTLLGTITLAYAQPLLQNSDSQLISAVMPVRKQVIGFLPYWLIEKADKDYSPYITQLTYFGLTIETDGHIQKYTDSDGIEGEPGWVALNSGRADRVLKNAKQHNRTLSLLIFRAENDAITELLSDPENAARTLIEDVMPIMKEYGFRDLNIDIEHVGRANDDERARFITFLTEVKRGISNNNLGTLTVEITGSDLIKKNLSDPEKIGNIADYVVIMAYDYHFAGSGVTGPVAPLGGGGTYYEYDTKIAVEKALEIIPAEKIILGIPLYGYQWETIGTSPGSAIIPGTGQTASHRRVMKQLLQCNTCNTGFDEMGKEPYVVYTEDGADVYDQIFYPDERSTQSKVDLAEALEIGGIALWALGYEGEEILNPLKSYIQ